MSATEEVLEQVPEAVVEDVVEAVNGFRHNPVVLVGVALIAGSLGALGGYKLSQKRLRAHYEDIANQEIEEAKAYYGHLRKEGVAETPDGLLENLHGKEAVDAIAAHRKYSGMPPAETPVENEEELMSDEEKALHEKHGVDPRPPIEEVVESSVKVQKRHNVFASSSPTEEDTFSYEEELVRREREPNKPYVISHDEFFEAEKDYEQTHVTYYQGDDVLVDERDQPIPDEEATVGNDNLTRFGHGSKDENIVYVRNEAIEVDFEITRSFGKYSVEVLDLEDDDEHGLKHSAHHGGLRRFRNFDD